MLTEGHVEPSEPGSDFENACQCLDDKLCEAPAFMLPIADNNLNLRATFALWIDMLEIHTKLHMEQNFHHLRLEKNLQMVV